MSKPIKKLELNRQTLRELTPKELSVAAGALTPYIKTLPVGQCLMIPTEYSECIPLQ
jgi:hypothetical protein